MVTSAKTWRKAREEGVPFKFPISGFVAAIRPIEADFFLLHGTIPDVLAVAMNTVLDGKDAKIWDVPVEELQEKKDKWLPFLNELASYAFVDPVCVNGDPGQPLQDNEISVWDVPYQDKVQLYRFFCRPAVVLEKFRVVEEEPVAGVAAPATNGHSPVEAAALVGVGEPDSGDAGSADELEL